MRARKAAPLRVRRTDGRGAAGGDLGQVVERLGVPRAARRQVVRCGRGISVTRRGEQPRGGVPLLHRCGQTAIGAGELHDGGNRLCRCYAGRPLALQRDFPADRTCSVECIQRRVEIPARAVMNEPPGPGRDMAQLVRVPVGVRQRQRILGGGRQLAVVL